MEDSNRPNVRGPDGDPSLAQSGVTVQFALERHGFADSNGGFGITYPGDLDEHDRVIEGRHIPEEYVLAYGFWGPPSGYEVLVPEWLYRDVLAEVLECLGMWREAASVRVPEGWLGPDQSRK